ncbi:MAG: hypothetical protein HYR66_05270 [Sphingobacteriales bacterium]|nr:hypothetical protein [Sphingobacteriales bacterium]MBI3719934.1 hypothetical protein [Sphingobacteriales bacterium]
MEILFFKSKYYPDFYFIYKGKNGVNAERMLRNFSNTGEFENSGYPKIEIEMGFTLKTDAPESFVDYLTENVATNHIVHPDYNSQNFRAWYEFKDVTNIDKWLTDYYSLQENKANVSTVQTMLF